MAEDSSDDGQNGWKKSPKVIIIGAGIAGIAAGNYLADHGLTDFTILEATDRIGGRILSVDLETVNGMKAELGANWIHGIDRNPIFKISTEHGLLTPHFEGRKLGKNLMFIREDGEPVNTKYVGEVDWEYGLLMSQVEDFYQMQMPTPMDDDSVGDYMMREFEEKISRLPMAEQKLRRMIFQQRLLNESVISGCNNMSEVALAASGSFEELPGIHYVIPAGFEAVCDILMKNIPAENLLLEHPVTQITWDDTFTSNHSDYEVCVECANGKKLYANHVIVTISLGCLQHLHGRMFSPPLPEFKLNAINNLEIGTVNKVVLEFEGQVLADGVFRLELLWDRDHINNENNPKANWVKKFGFFEAITKNVLVGWLCGREAEYMESLSEQEVGEKCREMLMKFLRKTNIPKLRRCVRSQWKSMPYCRGAYIFIPVGATSEDVENMAEPVLDSKDKPVLLWAGEATHPSFYSSSHGALLSGQREAQRILDQDVH